MKVINKTKWKKIKIWLYLINKKISNIKNIIEKLNEDKKKKKKTFLLNFFK
jgi:hypothetical protein